MCRHNAPRCWLSLPSEVDLYTCAACGLLVSYCLTPHADDTIRQTWIFVGATDVAHNHLPPAARSTIRLPPLQRGSAHALAYGPLDDRVRPTGRSAVLQPYYVAFYRQPHDTAVMRYYCDTAWAILHQDSFPSMSAAVTALELDFEGAATLLMPLTP